MNTDIPAEMLSRPFSEWQLNLTTLFLMLMLAGRLFKSLKSGGGLIGIWRGILYGENIPTPIAKDYAREIEADRTGKPGGLGPVAMIAFALLPLGILLGSTACTSPATPPTAEQREAQILKIAGTVEGLARVGVAGVLVKNPELAPYFTAASEAILIAVDSGTVEPAALSALIRQALTQQGGGDYADMAGVALTGAVGLYQMFYAVNVDAALDTRPAFRSVILALAHGVRSGSSLTPAAGPTDSLRIHDDLILR